MYYETGGAFNPGVGTVEKDISLNDKLIIEHDFKNSDFGENLSLDEKSGSAKILKGMRIDLSAIAKGFIVDRIVDKLRELGVRNAIVNAGGDLYCMGYNGKTPWNIGIRNPHTRQVRFFIEVTEAAVCTSGDYETTISFEEKKYSHIIDSRDDSFHAVEPSSATIIGDSCARADAFATACYLLSFEDCKRLDRERQDLELCIIRPEGVYFSENLKVSSVQ